MTPQSDDDIFVKLFCFKIIFASVQKLSFLNKSENVQKITWKTV